MADTSPSRGPGRTFLIIPLVIALILLGGYTVLWFYGAKVMRTEIAEFVADERANGRRITYENIGIRGFPVSVRAVAENFVWMEPGAWRWRGEDLHIAAQPWDLDRLILAPRGTHDVTVGEVVYDVTPGSLRVGIGNGAYGAEGSDIGIASADATVTLGGMMINFEGTAGETADWILGAQITEIDVDREDGANLRLPFARLVASHEPGQNGAAIEALELAIADADSLPPTVIGLSGEAGIDRAGYPAGQLDLTYTDTSAMEASLARMGVPASPLATFTSLLAAYRAGADDATIPLRAQDGALYLSGLGNIKLVDLPQVQRPPTPAP